MFRSWLLLEGSEASLLVEEEGLEAGCFWCALGLLLLERVKERVAAWEPGCFWRLEALEIETLEVLLKSVETESF